MMVRLMAFWRSRLGAALASVFFLLLASYYALNFRLFSQGLSGGHFNDFTIGGEVRGSGAVLVASGLNVVIALFFLVRAVPHWPWQQSPEAGPLRKLLRGEVVLASKLTGVELYALRHQCVTITVKTVEGFASITGLLDGFDKPAPTAAITISGVGSWIVGPKEAFFRDEEGGYVIFPDNETRISLHNQLPPT